MQLGHSSVDLQLKSILSRQCNVEIEALIILFSCNGMSDQASYLVKFSIWENSNDYNSNGDKFMRVYEAPIGFWC